MSIDEATVKRVANLARIALKEGEAEALKAELSAILDWVEQLDEVDTADVAPLANISNQALYKREDKVTDGGIADDIVASAPMQEDHYFMVPKVVE